MDKTKVFEGVKILEFAWAIVGPASSRYLADHGATVVKVESHQRLDVIRTTNPFAGGKPGVDASMLFGKYNPNKFCVSLDLNKPRGRELALRLIRWADIVTESFSPRMMKRWGLDYERVKEIKPDIIYFSSSMQGNAGPHASFAGYGYNACALSGFTELSGWPDRVPASPFAYTDFICPSLNAMALISALEYRRRTGRGQWIEQSQFEAGVQFLAPLVMDYQINNRVATRQGNHLGEATPHGVFPCQGDDRWVAISIFSDAEWEAFVTASGAPDWAKDEKFRRFQGRKDNEDELEKLIADWTARFEAPQIEKMLQAAGIAANIVAKPSDTFADPQLKHRDHFVRVDHPVMGRPAYEQQACFIMSKTPRKIVRPSPCLGEHNEYVFKELLKMTDDEIADYIIDGSITTQLPQEFRANV
jgi:benzylsuccinate CoA-transferase BbsF subunit